jgi:hypothetical protein
MQNLSKMYAVVQRENDLVGRVGKVFTFPTVHDCYKFYDSMDDSVEDINCPFVYDVGVPVIQGQK